MRIRDAVTRAANKLIKPEHWVWLAAGTGALVDLRAGVPELDDPAGGAKWDAARTVRAELLVELLVGARTPLRGGRLRAVQLRGARITGWLNLEAVTLGCPLLLQDCHLEQWINLNEARAPVVRLPGCHLPVLAAEQLETRGNLQLDRGFTATGEVRLPGAHIGGQLNLNGASLTNPNGPALNADRLTVDQGMYCWEGFTATGEVHLVGAHIGGQLDCTDATMRNDSGPALHAERLQVDQNVLLSGRFEAVGAGGGVTLDLSQARIGGVLEFAPARLEHTANPQARLALDGLTYTGLPAGISSSDWLRLLRQGTKSYTAQPYQQVAAAHRAAGHDGEVRRILMAQRQDQLDRGALTGRADRAWARLTGLTLGYGYQPWRALLALVAIATTAVVLALTLGAHGGVARVDPKPPAATRCSAVERVGVGLDLGVPLIKTGIRDHCDTTASTTGQALTATGWGLQLLAWAFATLFVAGFTGIVRKT